MSPEHTPRAIAHYRITAKLGEGGMGEVYRAIDTKLDREVALKILPAAFAADADRMARFEREAKVLAALNHPNIAAIYGVEERALVMELVEGEMLAGPLPIETALNYAKQIAEALEAAHDKGITHRDLKPANVKVTPAGVVKVLDFGLAAVAQSSGSEASNPTRSPTLTMRATEAGTIMGTAAYMSPEQAAGKPVDKRADIWSFGVVLWELLSGQRLFDGETVSHTLASVLRAEIDFNQLPAGTPLAIRDLLRRCLDRDVKNRLRDIGEARVLLQSPQRVETPAPTARPGSWRPILTGALLLATLGLGYVAFRHVTEEARVFRFSVLPPEKTTAGIHALSPDGRRLAFVTIAEGRNELWVRELDSLVARPLTGTDTASYPFWSPDSRTIAFFQGGKLKKMDAAGGPALTLCDAPQGRGGSWGRNGVIIFAPFVNTGIRRVSAAGGESNPVTTLDQASGENAHRMPWFLPDGRHFLYTARNNEPEKNAVYVADLDSKGRKIVLAASSEAVYAPPGFLLFLREQMLMAQPFDASSATAKGDAIPIAEQIRYDGLNLVGWFTVSQNGVLAYTSGSVGMLGAAQLTWFDRTGKVTGTVGAPGAIQKPAISPDGQTVAFDRLDPRMAAWDLWLFDQVRGTESRFTFSDRSTGTNQNQTPVWSPDGSHIAFRSVRPGTAGPGTLVTMFQRAVSGTAQEEALALPRLNAAPTDWSRDGRYILAQVSDPKTNFDIWVLPLFGDRKALPYLQTEFNEVWAKLSPNGQWLAYTSDETKRNEVYVRTFPNPGRKWQVSTNGGTRPVWSRDGKELFFIDIGRKMMAVEVKSGAKFEAGAPKPLFATRFAQGNSTWFDVSKDGRFLIPS